MVKLGQIVGTPGALAVIEKSKTSVNTLLNRFVAKDWGDMEDEDKQMNDEALELGNRLLAAYEIEMLDRSKNKIWIITECDRSCTTLMLPSEY